jgi:hypothetical protein
VIIGRYVCLAAVVGLDLAVVSNVLRNTDGADMKRINTERKGEGRCSWSDYSKTLLSDVQRAAFAKIMTNTRLLMGRIGGSRNQS